MERLFNLSMVWYKITLLNGSLKLKSLSLVLLVLLVKVSPFTHLLTRSLLITGGASNQTLFFALPPVWRSWAQTVRSLFFYFRLHFVAVSAIWHCR